MYRTYILDAAMPVESGNPDMIWWRGLIGASFVDIRIGARFTMGRVSVALLNFPPNNHLPSKRNERKRNEKPRSRIIRNQL